MFPSQKVADERHPGKRKLLRSGLAAALLTLLAGCANPGAPKPPSLHVPQLSTHITAERIGSHVLLSWTTSNNTTAGETIKGPITAAICRQDLLESALPEATRAPSSASIRPATLPTVPCNPVQRVPATPGVSHASEFLPPSLLTGPPRLIAFQIELLNARSRSAGPSEPVYTVAGAAPAPAGPITVSPRRNGALITWQPQAWQPQTEQPRTGQPQTESASAPLQLSRMTLASSSAPAKPAPAGRSKPPSTHSKAANSAPQPAILTAPKQATEPGGIVDRTIQDGDTVSYTAQRVETVSFKSPPAASPTEPAKPAKGLRSSAPKPSTPSTLSLELRGDPSPTVTFTYHDVFPPSAPTGLAAIPGGGFGQSPSIDLSWEPNSESDLLGYNVYRAEAPAPGATPTFTRLTPAPLPGTGFRDLNAQPGHSYLYRITAIDQHHNESTPGPTLTEQIHP